MARQVLPIVGAVVGAFFGSPQIGYAIGAVVGNLVDPVINQGPKIGETGAQTSQEGAPRAIIYGTASCTGNIIAAGPIIKSTELESADGGKGSEKTEVERAYRNYAIRICEGPIAGILRIWEDDKLVYDIRSGSLMLSESAKWTANKNVFLGDEAQLPSAFLNLNVPPLGDHPAHRGTAYIVFGLEDLTDRRGSIPQYRFEVAKDLGIIDLPVIPSTTSSMIGGGGGGSFAPGAGFTATNTLDGPRAPGEVYCARFNFAAGGASGSLRMFLKLDGVEIWGKDRTFVIGQTSQDVVQFNHPSDPSLLTIGFDPGPDGWEGDFQVRTWKLTTSEVFTAFNNGDPPPITMEPSNPYFGIVVGEDGRLCSAGEINDGVGTINPWGPETYMSYDGEPVELDAIVSDIHQRCGVPASKYDVSELTDLVAGLVLAGDYTGADAINTLRGPYFFDKAEYSKKLHYPKRGAAVVATLTIDDLVEEPDLSKREQAVEFAKKMHLFYQHAASGYAAVKATSLRSSPDARVVGETSLQVPVVLNEDQAAQTVSKLHKVSWAEAEGEVTFTLPESFIRLIPSNNVGLVLRGQAKRLRIEKREHESGLLKYTLRHDRQSAYASNLTGVPIPPPTLPPPTIAGDTTLAILDIASRIDTEDDLHYLSAGIGALPAWYGYALQRSLDGGANYSTVGQYGASIIGELLEDVPTASEFYTDSTNSVYVQLIRDGQSLQEFTDLQFLSEQGAFALEKYDGSWEVMQYRDAIQDSSGAYILRTLHRGLLNSGASSHTVGAKFVMLDRVQHIPAISAWIGQELTHRAASLGESPEIATPQTATYYGRSQIEWPVAYLQLSRDGSDNITASWTPRHRFGTDDAPVASINFQGYRVVLDDGGSTVSFDTLTPGFVYDASALGPVVTVSIYALNRITGAGPATSGAI